MHPFVLPGCPQVRIMHGVLDMAGKTAADVMIPIERVFMLDIERRLDHALLQARRRLCPSLCGQDETAGIGFTLRIVPSAPPRTRPTASSTRPTDSALP